MIAITTSSSTSVKPRKPSRVERRMVFMLRNEGERTPSKAGRRRGGPQHLNLHPRKICCQIRLTAQRLPQGGFPRCRARWPHLKPEAVATRPTSLNRPQSMGRFARLAQTAGVRFGGERNRNQRDGREYD